MPYGQGMKKDGELERDARCSDVHIEINKQI